MFKIEQRLKNRIRKWTKRKRITCEVCSWIVMILAMVSVLFGMAGNKSSQVRALIKDVSLLEAVIWLVIVFILCYLSYKIIRIINSVTLEERQKEREYEILRSLEQELSYKEYREVIYSPYLRRYEFNSKVPYEDEELKHCTNLLNTDDITHYAMLVTTHVFIISINKEGKQIGERTVDVITFCDNYQIFEN